MQVFQLERSHRRDTICHRGALWSRLCATKIPRSGICVYVCVCSKGRAIHVEHCCSVSHRFSLIYAFRSGLEETSPASRPTILEVEKETTEMSSSILGWFVPPLVPLPAIKRQVRRSRGMRRRRRISRLEHLPIFVIYYRCRLVNSALYDLLVKGRRSRYPWEMVGQKLAKLCFELNFCCKWFNRLRFWIYYWQ